MRRALDEVVVTGIQTTLPFDRALVRDPAFMSGDELSTDWVSKRWDGTADRVERYARAADAAARAVLDPGRESGSSLHKDAAPGEPWREVGRASAVDRWPR